MYIEITGTPAGEAPDWVRDAWIGCILSTPGIVKGYPVFQFVSKTTEIWDCYPVSYPNALAVLRNSGKEDAAQWWQSHASIFGEGFLFKADECREVIPSSGQEMATHPNLRDS